MTDLDPNFLVFIAALEATAPRERVDAASSLGDLSRGDVHPEDFERVVAALLVGAARESDAESLEAMLYTLLELADRPDSGEQANWDPMLPLLDTVSDPECLGYVLSRVSNHATLQFRRSGESIESEALAQ